MDEETLDKIKVEAPYYITLRIPVEFEISKNKALDSQGYYNLDFDEAISIIEKVLHSKLNVIKRMGFLEVEKWIDQ